MNKKWLIIDFIVSTIFAVVSNIVASYLQEKFNILKDGNRIIFVATIFVITFVLGGFIAWKKGSNGSVNQKNKKSLKTTGISIGDESEVGDISTNQVAGQNIGKFESSGRDISEESSTGILIGDKAKVKNITADKVAGKNIEITSSDENK